MDRDQLDNICEKTILGLVLAVLLFTPLALGAVRLQEFVIVQWLCVAILGVWFVRFFVNPKHRLLWIPMSWPVLGFMLYAVVRAYAADVEYLARHELIRVLVYGAIFFAVVNNLHRQETTQILGVSLIALAMLLSVYAVFQFLTATDEVVSVIGEFTKPEGYRKRGSATFISPNNLAGYLEMVLPLALSFTLIGRFSPVQKIFLGYASLVIFAGLSATVSRGGWLASVVSLLVLFFYLVRQRDYWKRALLTLGALVAGFAIFFMKAEKSPERIERFDEAKAVEDVRVKLWAPAAAMWKDHALFGVGPNHFDERFRQYRPADPALQGKPERTHNDYLNALVDWGLVGTALIAACWTIFFIDVFRSWKHVQRAQNDLGAKRSNKSAFVLGGSLGLVAILVHSFVDFNMHVPATAILAVVILALVGAHYRFATERHWWTVRWKLRIPLTTGLIVLFGYLTWQSWIGTREALALARAGAPGVSSVRRDQMLRHAMTIEPTNFATAYTIGEDLFQESQLGDDGYEQQARDAMDWFKRCVRLNPYHAPALVRLGMCHDWVGDHTNALAYFEQAHLLDPNGYLTRAHLGWHYFQVKDYTNARKWFADSIALVSDATRNPIATSYLRILDERSRDGTLEK